MLMKDFRFFANKEKSSLLLGVSKHQEAEKIFRFVNACITQSRLNTHDLGCISCSTSMELILADVLFFCTKTEKKHAVHLLRLQVVGILKCPVIAFKFRYVDALEICIQAFE